MSLASFIKKYNLFLDKQNCTPDCAVLKSSISTHPEAFEFVRVFGLTTASDWVPHVGRLTGDKYDFCYAWICQRGWNPTVLFRQAGPRCSARIEILCEKSPELKTKVGTPSQRKPPLTSTILLFTQHLHATLMEDSLQMQGLTPELKEKFFQYFESGMTAIEARLNHDIFLQSINGDEEYDSINFNLSMKQAERLYNSWTNVMNVNGCARENSGIFKVPVTSLIKAIPIVKDDSPEDPIKRIQKPSAPFAYGLKPPLVFIPADPNVPACEPLLYQLKYGPEGKFVSRLTLPQIVCVRIGQSEATIPIDESEMCRFKDHRGYEPDVDEDLSSDAEPVIIPCSTQPPIVPPTDKETHIMPLVFTFSGTTCSHYEMDSPSLFTLNRGRNQLIANSATFPKIESVEIKNSHEALLKIQGSPPLVAKEQVIYEYNDDTQGLLSQAEKEPLKKASATSTKKRKLNVSKAKRKVTKNDEDYQFLMSLLPDLRRIPEGQKKQVKSRIQEFVATSRIGAASVPVKKLRNAYTEYEEYLDEYF